MRWHISQRRWQSPRLSVPAKTHCSGWMWADFPKNVNRGSTMIQTTNLSPRQKQWPQNMVSSISNQFWLLITSSPLKTPRPPSLFLLPCQHLSFLATPLLFPTTQPSRAFIPYGAWGNPSVSLWNCSMGSGAASSSVVSGQKELGSHMSLCAPSNCSSPGLLNH